MRLPSLPAVTAAALLTSGCATSVRYDPPAPYTAIEARIDGETLRVRYLGPEGLLYADCRWPEGLPSAVSGDGVAAVLLTPVSTGRQPVGERLTGRRVAVLGPAEYAEVRDGLVRALVPPDHERAVVVGTAGGDVTLFYGSDGVLRTVEGPPPEGVEVVERRPLEDVLGAPRGGLARLLAEHGVGAGEVLFNTGDHGEDPVPFLYVDQRRSFAAYVRVTPLAGDAAAAADPVVPLTRSLTHFVASHTIGFLNRPVSSVLRLLFMVSDAIQDTFDPVWTLGLESAEVPPLTDDPGMDLTEWEAEIDRMTGRRSSKGTVAYLIDGDAFFARLEETVLAARSSVLVRTYIFDDDDVALEVAELLKARAHDGLDVRVLLDGIGTIGAAAQAPAGLPAGHVPPVSVQSHLRDGSPVEVRTVLNPFFTGDHTKTIVIDEQVAFLGGMNIGREYRYEWHDMMAEVRGPVVAELLDDFDLAWAGAGFLGDLRELLVRLGPRRTPGPEAGSPVRVLYTRPSVSEIRNVQLAALRRARRYVYLENAYLTDDTFLHELVRARRRGVDVRVVVPLRSDRGILARDNVLAANVMYRNGIRVYIYPGMSHIKAAVYDGWACLGSANVDQLSLRVNREANIATSAPEAVEPLLRRVFEADFRASAEMREEFPPAWHDALWELVGDYAF